MPPCEIQVSPEAQRDLIEIFGWYESSGGYQLSRKFLESVEKSFRTISKNFAIGRKRNFRSRRLAGVRSLAVTEPFSVYLIFYLPVPDSILVLRVLHGMRDLPPLLEGD
jgi:plasmid stabilization system protein ParE